MTLLPRPESGSMIRTYRPEDEPWVRELIDADGLPGQPRCTPEGLATTQRAPAPLADWEVTAGSQVRVLADAENRPRGIIA